VIIELKIRRKRRRRWGGMWGKREKGKISLTKGERFANMKRKMKP